MKQENKLIARNTLFLYMRIAVVMLITLYTSRMLLKALGVDDFGTYNVVGSIVMMFNSIKGLFVSSTQRFLNFELGKGDAEKLNTVFCSSILIHILICIIFILIIEPVGLWFVNYKMKIPDGNIGVANILLQLSIASSVFTIMAIPYDATLITTQRMNVYAYLSVFDVFMKLGSAALLLVFAKNRLLIYGVLMLLTTIVYRSLSIRLCRKHDFCRFKWRTDKKLLKEMGKFAGWNFLGNMTFSVSNEGQNLLLNTTFGPAINAARAIAYQVRNAFLQLTSNMTLAFRPRLTHLYAQDNKHEMTSLAISGMRFACFAEFCLIIPLYFYIPQVLDTWLTVVPNYSEDIIRCIFLYVLIKPIGSVNDSLFNASAKMKEYQCVTAAITFSSFLAMIVYLSIDKSVLASFWIYNIGAILNVLISSYLLCKKEIVEDHLYVSGVVKLLLTCVCVALINTFIYQWIRDFSTLSWVLNFVLLIILSALTIFLVGLNSKERARIKGFITAKS